MDEDVTNVQSRMRVSGAMIGLTIAIWISTSMAHASEVWVQQARARISGGTTVAEENKLENKPKAAPEGASASATPAGSPTNPATCNQQNASSPACYSATQQTKGK
jgi:hypothetical protein